MCLGVFKERFANELQRIEKPREHKLECTVSDRVLLTVYSKVIRSNTYPFCEPPYFRNFRAWRFRQIRWHHITLELNYILLDDYNWKITPILINLYKLQTTRHFDFSLCNLAAST